MKRKALIDAPPQGGGGRGYNMARPLPRYYRLRRKLLGLFYAVGLVFVIGALGHVAYGFYHDVPYLRLTKLKIEGISSPVAKDVEGAIEAFVGSNPNLMSIDLDELKQTILSDARLQGLQLEKLYPDTLLIKARERKAAAIINADEFYLVDRDGVVMKKLRPTSLRNYDFPFISGIEPSEVKIGEKVDNPALSRALDLVKILAERNPELFTLFSEVHIGKDPISDLYNITGQMRGGLEVRFGDRNPIDRLPALEFFLEKLEEQNIELHTLAYIDLRFENQIVYMDSNTAFAVAAGMLDNLLNETDKEQLKKNAAKTTDPSVAPAITSNDQPAKQAVTEAMQHYAAQQQHAPRAPEPRGTPRGSYYDQLQSLQNEEPQQSQEYAAPPPQQKQRRGLLGLVRRAPKEETVQQQPQPRKGVGGLLNRIRGR